MRLLLIGLSASLLGLVFASSSVVEWLGPDIHEFGDVIHKEEVSHQFQFRNITDQPLVVDNVRPACGCTTPEWDIAPVLPDSIGTIRVTYDARDVGYFKKKVKVYFSGQRKAEVLYLEGWVEQL